MNAPHSFSSLWMSVLCAFSALLMVACQDNIKPDDDGNGDDPTDEPVDPPVEDTDPAITSFEPVGGGKGTEVILSGANFGTDASAVKVVFVDTDLETEKEAEIISVADDAIRVSVPAGPGEECRIKVVISGETGEEDVELTYEALFDYTYRTTVTTLFGSTEAAASNPTGTFTFSDAGFYGTFDNNLAMDKDGNLYLALQNSEIGFMNAKSYDAYKVNVEAGTVEHMAKLDAWWSSNFSLAVNDNTGEIFGLRGDPTDGGSAPCKGKTAYYDGAGWTSEVEFTWDKDDNLGSGNGSTCRAIAVRPSTGEIYFMAYGVLGVLDYNTKIVANKGLIIEDMGAAGSFRTEPATGLVFDPNDDNVLYISLADLGHIYKYTIDSNTCERVCGGYYAGYINGYQDGALSDALLDHPGQICMDRNNNIYVADQYNCCIRKIDLDAGQVTTYAGKKGVQGNSDGSLDEALFDDPTGIAISEDGVIYVSEKDNHGIRRIATE